MNKCKTKIIEFAPELKNEYYNMSMVEKKRSFLNKPNIMYDKLLVSMIGKYSIMRHNDAKLLINMIYNHMKSYDIIITDATGGVGGTTIYLLDKFKYVKTVEINEFHQKIIKNNVDVYGFKNHTLYFGDYMKKMNRLKQDVIVLDPPWGGTGYKTKKKLDLKLNNICITQIINQLFDKNKCKLVILFIPFNYNIVDFKGNIKYKYNIKNNRFIKIYNN